MLLFRAPPNADGSPQIEVCGILGEYGGGKSFIAGTRFMSIVLENPFEPEAYAGGLDVPMSGIVAPTAGDLKKGTLVQLLKVCPDELIYKVQLHGDNQHIQFINGHKVLLYSAEGALNGPTLCQIWADEIQEKVYDKKWTNLQGRVREKRARRLNAQASGIAERGHVEEIFRRADSPNRCTVLLYPEDNAGNLAAGYVSELQASLPASRERDEDGWLLPQDAMFPRFARVRNVRLPASLEGHELHELYERPTSFGVDLGRKSAVVFGQPADVLVRGSEPGTTRRELGALLVDQLMPEGVDAEELVQLIKREKSMWRLVPGKSIICIDPTAEPDQVRWFQRGFPGISIVQHHGGFHYEEANGLRAVDRALLDGNRDVRLYVHPSLSAHPSGRGVVEMFSSHRASKPKDKVYEHACDAGRYLVQMLVPLPLRPRSTDRDVEDKLDRETRSLTGGLRERSF